MEASTSDADDREPDPGAVLAALSREAPSRFAEALALVALDRYASEPLSYGSSTSRAVLGACEPLCARYPESAKLFSLVGAAVRASGHAREACGFYRRSLELDPCEASVERAFDDLKNELVSRWHYRMLNDGRRNGAYRRAISLCVKPGDRVLDLGCGVGLLSYYATKAGAAGVLACDRDPVMRSIAERALKNLPVVSVVGESSFDLETKADVCVTEIFDAGLLGESAIAALSDVHARCMNSNRIVPQSARMYLCGVRGEALKRKRRLVKDFAHYDTEDSSFFQNIEFITDPALIFEVDFTDAKALKVLNETNSTFSISLKNGRSGPIDAYISWFELILYEDVKISTDPRSSDRCSAWDVAVFYSENPKMITGDGASVDVTIHRRPDRFEIISEAPNDRPRTPIPEDPLLAAIQGLSMRPCRVRTVARLLQSKNLDRRNRVLDENLATDGDFHVADLINAYSVTENRFSSSDGLDEAFLSGEVTLFERRANGPLTGTIQVVPTENGEVNAVRCHRIVRFLDNGEEQSTDEPYLNIDHVYHLIDPPVQVLKDRPVDILFFSADNDFSTVKIVLDVDD